MILLISLQKTTAKKNNLSGCEPKRLFAWLDHVSAFVCNVTNNKTDIGILIDKRFNFNQFLFT